MAIIEGQEVLQEARELVEIADKKPRGYLTVVLSILAVFFAVGWWKERSERQAEDKEQFQAIIRIADEGREAAIRGRAYADSAINLQGRLIEILSKKQSP